MVSYDEKNIYEISRRVMIEHHLKGRDINDERVLKAIAEIPREIFVPLKYAAQSYDDNPLPIGIGQTISQPYIVALMTQCLKLTGNEEVSSKSVPAAATRPPFWQQLAKKVYTIERFNELAEAAQTALASLGLENIDYYIGDGSSGWPEREAVRPHYRHRRDAADSRTAGKINSRKAACWSPPSAARWTQDLIVAEKQGTDNCSSKPSAAADSSNSSVNTDTLNKFILN